MLDHDLKLCKILNIYNKFKINWLSCTYAGTQIHSVFPSHYVVLLAHTVDFFLPEHEMLVCPSLLQTQLIFCENYSANMGNFPFLSFCVFLPTLSHS